MPSLILMAAWRNFGTAMIIFLAGLQTSRTTARGGRDRRRRRAGSGSATSPCRCCGPRCCSASVTTAIGYLQFFEEPFVMTKGGPLDSTISVSIYTYNQFGFGNYGFAAAMSYMLFVVIAVVTFIQFRVLRERHLRGADHGYRPFPLLATPVALPRAHGRPGRRRRAVRVDGARRFKPEGELRQSPPTWWPQTGSLDNYTQLFTQLELRQVLLQLASSWPSPSRSGTCCSARCSATPSPSSSSRASGRSSGSCSATLMIPGRRDFRAAVRPGHQRWAGRHAARAVPAVPGRPVRRVPDAPVHHRPAATS